MLVNEVALRRQATVLALLALILTGGLYCYSTLPREASPDITIPYVFVTTTYEGVAPEDVETLVTIPIERKLKGLSDVEEIRSTSAEGISHVAIKFLPSVDIDDAVQKVRDKVDQAKPDLPSDIPDDPQIVEVNFSDMPIIRVVLSGPFSLRRLQTMAEDLEDRIESVSGVLDVELVGGLEREIHVEFDLDRVAAYNVPFSSIVSSVTRSNVNQPGGSMDIGEGKYLVRVPEDFKDPTEIFSVVAFVRDGKPVYLRDLAEIKDANKDPLTRSRINGATSVTLAVKKRTGENIVRITDEVKRIVAQAQTELPAALEVALTEDQSNDVRLMVSDLENNILSGLILVLVVILAFIGGRSALLVALAIPYSMFITFMLLTGFSVTLNMVVLFSLILALGMLVDNGIVIVENIYRHMQEGKSRYRAALDGTNEVAWPVITSTMTTLGAFFPMLFWPGIMGEFMGYLPQTLIMALTASLFVALVINPVLSARYQKVRRAKRGPRKHLHEHGEAHGRPPVPGEVAGEGGETRLEEEPLIKRAYFRLLNWSLNHRAVVMVVSVLMLVGVIAAFAKFGAGVEFFPETEPRRAYVRIQAPEGTNLNASDVLVRQVEDIVEEYDDIRYVIANVGTVGGDPFSGGGSGTHISSVALDFVDFWDRRRPSSEIIEEVRDRVTEAIQGAEVRVEKQEEGPPTGKPVNIEISGKDIRVLGMLAKGMAKAIRDVPGLVDLQDNFVKGKPEILVRIDKEKAAIMGLDAATIAYTVKAAINGVKVGVYREGKDEYDIVARLPEKDRGSVESLRSLTISGYDGQPIPLTSVAQLELASGVGAIQRLDQKRVVTVSADVVGGANANRVIGVIDHILSTDFPWPKGYGYEFSGEQQEQQKAQDFLSKAFISALGIILVILLTQFNSFATPFIVLASVLLSLIGVFLGLIVTQTPFGIIMTGIGVISLAGVVVNNAIVLIDYYQQLMDRGMDSRNALLRAGMVRFRPVMLTAVTTILGLMPMATGISYNFRKLNWEIGGESSQWWGPMAVAVIFGLAAATLLTLVVVPVLCSLMHRRQHLPGDWDAAR
ncbi:MAG: efflux RND transporter permease subunit [Desulfatibacillaceae bacterium]